MKKDNWEHRGLAMKCATCMWFVEKAYPPVDRATPDADIPSVKYGNQIGRCRRRAPTMNGFPAVFQTDWCGDHKVDETKI